MKFGQRIIGIILMFAVFFNLAGFQITFSILKFEAKLQMKNYLRNHLYSADEIQNFSLNNPVNMNWHNKNEFEYNGEMYDVIEKTSDKLIVIKDEKEGKLKQTFLSHKKLHYSDKSNQRPLKDWFKKYKEKKLNQSFKTRIYFYYSHIPSLCKIKIHPDTLLTPETPPPQAKA